MIPGSSIHICMISKSLANWIFAFYLGFFSFDVLWNNRILTCSFNRINWQLGNLVRNLIHEIDKQETLLEHTYSRTFKDLHQRKVIAYRKKKGGGGVRINSSSHYNLSPIKNFIEYYKQPWIQQSVIGNINSLSWNPADLSFTKITIGFIGRTSLLALIAWNFL
jgi:hypothetical protein